MIFILKSAFDNVFCKLWAILFNPQWVKKLPTGLAFNKSAWVLVMAWCCQATSHYLYQWWPSLIVTAGSDILQVDNSSAFVTLIYSQYGYCRYGERVQTCWSHLHYAARPSLTPPYNNGNNQYGPVTMIVLASGHQVRCIPWVQMGTFNKEIGFLCGL